MSASARWDSGPPDDGGPTVPEWIGGVGIGQLQILSLQAADGAKLLCPFIVGKSMQDLVGDIEGTTTEANGTKYVLRVRDAGKAKKLIAMKQLVDGTAVSVTLHPVLNKRRCVITCREIINKSEEEVLKQLAKDRVIAVRRITRREEGEKVNTPSIILTINGTSVPEYVRVGPLRIPTRTYFPDPMLCYNCFDYGHTKQRCTSSAKCRNCSKVHSLEGVCDANPFCQHCQGMHSPANRSCPIYAKEKEIIRLRFSKGISYREAVKQFDAGGGSYAAVSQVQQRLITARDSPNNSELKQKDDLIKQLTETIAVLTKRVEELEKIRMEEQVKKKSKKQKKRSKQEAKEVEPEETQEDMEYETGSDLGSDIVEPKPTGRASGAASKVAEASSQVSGAIPKTNVPKVQKRQNTSIIPVPGKKPPNTSISFSHHAQPLQLNNLFSVLTQNQHESPPPSTAPSITPK